VRATLPGVTTPFDFFATCPPGTERVLGDELRALGVQRVRPARAGVAFAGTVADAYLFTMLIWTKHVGIDLARWPVLTAYKARVAARPKVREAMIAEGLIKQNDPIAA